MIWVVILMYVLLNLKVLDLIPRTNFGGLVIELDKISYVVLLVLCKVSATPILNLSRIFSMCVNLVLDTLKL